MNRSKLSDPSELDPTEPAGVEEGRLHDRALGAADSVSQSSNKLVFTKEELASLLGISLRTLQTMTRSGKIPCIRTAGRGGRVLFPRLKIEEWLSKQADRNCR